LTLRALTIRNYSLGSAQAIPYLYFAVFHEDGHQRDFLFLSMNAFIEMGLYTKYHLERYPQKEILEHILDKPIISGL
jgi:hypothetical protein